MKKLDTSPFNTTNQTALNHENLADIKALHELPTPWGDIGITAGTILALAIIIYAISKKIHHGKNKLNFIPTAKHTPVPWYIEAEKALQEINPQKIQSLWSDNYRAFYFTLSHIIRNILENSLNFNATDLTYKEILTQLSKILPIEKQEITNQYLSIIKDYFNRSELVLFAAHPAPIDWAYKDHKWVEDMLAKFAAYEIQQNALQTAEKSTKKNARSFTEEKMP